MPLWNTITIKKTFSFIVGPSLKLLMYKSPQMKSVHREADAKSVAQSGDIPLFISTNSPLQSDTELKAS
jgi:hypothetical protein